MTPRERFQGLLKQLFQYDVADLDFGIYRVLNPRRDVINQFIETDLLALLDKRLASGVLGARARAAAEVKDAADAVRSALGDDAIGADGALKEAYAATPLGREYLDALALGEGALDSAGLELSVMNHLYGFFSRYYDDGDFMTKRRYSQLQKFIVPYNGEEVLLHWANNDQYYIKSSDRFIDYRFRQLDVEVVFELRNAETARDNNKDDDLYFFPLASEIALREGVLTIPFQRRPLMESDGIPKTRRNDAQSSIIAASVGKLSKAIRKLDQDIFLKLTRAWRAINGQAQPISVLQHHILTYTGRNTHDFFVHKGLGRFLERELDFYLKNEVLNLSDLASGTPPQWEAAYELVTVIRSIAQDIINFLAQVEDFQKRMFEKRKLVLSTHYCLAASLLANDHLELVVNCDDLWFEWQRDLGLAEHFPGLSREDVDQRLEARREALNANPTMLIDTRHFTKRDEDTLLSSFDDLDGMTDGVLVEGENFQALNLLASRHKGSVQVVYIDPPYNTSGSEILYKNSYKHSTWLTMMENRLIASRTLFADDAVQCTLIDDAENPYLHVLLEKFFGRENYLATVVIRSKPQGRAVPSGFSPNHEYGIFHRVSPEGEVGRLPRGERQLRRYPERDEDGIFTWTNFRKTGSDSRRSQRPRSYYPVYVDEAGNITVPDMTWDEGAQIWTAAAEAFGEAVWPIDENQDERVWTTGWQRAQRESAGGLVARRVDDAWQIYRKYRPNQVGALPGTWWDAAKYSASESGTKVLKDIMGTEVFSYPKSIYAVEDCLRACGIGEEDLVLDYFGGSGTTAHAVINLNRQDGGRRKFIVVEMGPFFETALLPRVKRLAFAPEWRDGKAVRFNNETERAGSPRLIQYMSLESYDDSLENIELVSAPQDMYSDTNYVLKYMLDFESRQSVVTMGSAHLLRPLSLSFKANKGSQSAKVTPDIPTSFALMLGLHIESRVAAYDKERKYIVHRGLVGDRVTVVIWRDIDEWEQADYEQDRDFVQSQGWIEGADDVLVNGDSLLPGARSLDGLFRELMFAPV
jgi:adenine-specific DNA-methyltransferase